MRSFRKKWRLIDRDRKDDALNKLTKFFKRTFGADNNPDDDLSAVRYNRFADYERLDFLPSKPLEGTCSYDKIDYSKNVRTTDDYLTNDCADDESVYASCQSLWFNSVGPPPEGPPPSPPIYQVPRLTQYDVPTRSPRFEKPVRASIESVKTYWTDNGYWKVCTTFYPYESNLRVVNFRF